MGAKLAKGWADAQAREANLLWPLGLKIPVVPVVPRGKFAAGAPSLNPTEAEVQAEEDMLP